jgi:presenilin-like A22 family membrane protease
VRRYGTNIELIRLISLPDVKEVNLYMNNKISISYPELGLFAATRGMIGAGIGLMLSNRISREKRKAIGLPLFIVGALSTIPIAMRLFHKEAPPMEQ